MIELMVAASIALVTAFAGYLIGFRFLSRIPVSLYVIRKKVLEWSASGAISLTFWFLVVAGSSYLIYIRRYCSAAVILLVTLLLAKYLSDPAKERKWQLAAAKILESNVDSLKPYEIRKLRAVYKISSQASDVWWRVYSLVATKSVVSIKGIQIGARGAGVKGLDFASLRTTAWTSRGKAIIIPEESVDDDRIWRIYLIFTEPLQAGDQRDVILAGARPNTWAPLRLNGEDSGMFTLGTPVGHMEISLIFPRGIPSDSIVFSSWFRNTKGEIENIADKEKIEKEGNLRDRAKITWHIDNAHPGTYEFTIKCPDISRIGKGNWITRLLFH